MSKYKFVINDDYLNLSKFIETIPFEFDTLGEDVYIGRNRIKKVLSNNILLNIKRFRKPIFFNRIVYSFFRKPKAYKAYHNALKVIRKGFETPAPIALIEECKSGLLSYSYFVSAQLDGYNEIRDLYFSQLESKGDCQLLEAFAIFSGKLHDAGILHLDYSPGNILYSKQEDGTFLFALVDINRMKFQHVDMAMGCRNFARLFENDVVYNFIAPVYAACRQFDPEQCEILLLKEKSKFHSKKKRKKKIKKLLG